MVVIKVPALPAMLAAAAVGGVLAMAFQGVSFQGVLDAALSGYVEVSGVDAVDTLLSDGGAGRGGMDSMFWTISLVPLRDGLRWGDGENRDAGGDR